MMDSEHTFRVTLTNTSGQFPIAAGGAARGRAGARLWDRLWGRLCGRRLRVLRFGHGEILRVNSMSIRPS